MVIDAVGHEELRVLGPSVATFGKTDLLFAKRLAVSNGSVLLVRRTVTNMAVENDEGRPTLCLSEGHIGTGSPHKQATADAHGEPLGEEEIRLTKRSYGWPEDAKFLVPDGVLQHFAAGVGARGANARLEWTKLFDSYKATYPELAAQIEQMQRRELPAGW